MLGDDDAGEDGARQVGVAAPSGLCARLIKPKSNVVLLALVCFMFSSSALAEVVGALVADSLSCEQRRALHTLFRDRVGSDLDVE